MKLIYHEILESREPIFNCQNITSILCHVRYYVDDTMIYQLMTQSGYLSESILYEFGTYDKVKLEFLGYTGLVLSDEITSQECEMFENISNSINDSFNRCITELTLKIIEGL